MTRATVQVERDSRVTIPIVPNYIKLDEQYRALSEFTVLQLRAIAEAWGDRLIQRAAEQRASAAGTRG